MGCEEKLQGGANRDELVRLRNQNQTLINMNISSCLYQCYSLSSHFAIRYYFISLKKARASCIFLHLLGFASRLSAFK